MKRLVVIGMLVISPLVIIAEDYNYLELSQGIKINKKSNWNGDCPTALSIGRHWDYNPKTYFRAQFNHLSNICKGAPFSKSSGETWLDQVNVTIGVKF